MRDDGQECPVTGKRRYSTEGDAMATAAHQIATSPDAPKTLEAYRCSWCNDWHLTKGANKEPAPRGKGRRKRRR